MDSSRPWEARWDSYVVYGIWVLLVGCGFCLHLVMAALLWTHGQRPAALVIEIVYGLVNPVVYLLLLTPFLKMEAPENLHGAAWVLLGLVWNARFWGGLPGRFASEARRRAVQALLALSITCLATFFAKDVLVVKAPWPWDAPWNAGTAWTLVGALNVAALYAIPVIPLVRYLRRCATRERWADGEGFFVLQPWIGLRRVERVLVAAVAASLSLVATASLYRPSPGAVQQQLLAHRETIVASASRHGIDPRLVASVVYVVLSEHSTPLARQAERTAMGAWLTDRTNAVGLGPSSTSPSASRRSSRSPHSPHASSRSQGPRPRDRTSSPGR